MEGIQQQEGEATIYNVNIRWTWHKYKQLKYQNLMWEGEKLY